VLTRILFLDQHLTPLDGYCWILQSRSLAGKNAGNTHPLPAAMAEKLLSPLDCQRAKPKASPYRLNDGNGLGLRVLPNGSKFWQFRYRGRERDRSSDDRPGRKETVVHIRPLPATSLPTPESEPAKCAPCSIAVTIRRSPSGSNEKQRGGTRPRHSARSRLSG